MPYKDYEKQKENARINYYKNKEKRLLQAKAYYQKNWADKQLYRKEWRKNNPDKVSIAVKKYNNSSKGKAVIKKLLRKRYLLDLTNGKIAARQAVRNAIRRKDITRLPCVICGKIPAQAHHYKGYEKNNYLDVMWLCAKHHREKHNNNVSKNS
jgi:hypothetical protein